MTAGTDAGTLAAIPFEQRWKVVEPVITAHLVGLRMDTDADNDLLDEIRIQWNWLVTGRIGMTAEELRARYHAQNPAIGRSVPFSGEQPSETSNRHPETGERK